MTRALACLLLPFACAAQAWAYTPKEGDLLFQTSRSAQSVAIQKATHSPYSHVGMLLFHKGRPFVFEAVGPVKFTPVAKWEARGKNGRYVAKRARKPLPPAAIATLHRLAARYAGKPYDFTFEWSDRRMYCSELVWKLYKGAGITLAPLARLGSFDLSDPVVRKIMKQRYGSHVPLDEPVIAPSALFDSPLLITVADGRAPNAR
ncbi:MAG TPA: YiiX family permuted papain-like enzyme [Gallionellaceae bacterium]|nr:YiiX family permuted papain-like enzyme [Gallionellaceae bacterium]